MYFCRVTEHISQSYKANEMIFHGCLWILCFQLTEIMNKGQHLQRSIQHIKQDFLGRTNCLLSIIWHGIHRKLRDQQFFYCCMCIHCCGNILTELSPSNNGEYTYRHTNWWEEFMKYTTEIGSGAMILSHDRMWQYAGFGLVTGFNAHLYISVLHFTNHYRTH
jgi:hypothetical protein